MSACLEVCLETRLYQNLPGPATQVTKLNKNRLAAQWDKNNREKETEGEGKKKKRREVISIVIQCTCPGDWLGIEGPMSQYVTPAQQLQQNQCHKRVNCC